MKKQDFISKQASIKNQIADLEQQLIELKRDYISENCKFVPCDFVKVVTPEITANGHTFPEKVEYGYVNFVRVNLNNEPEPVLFKAKKNGCPSKVRLYISPRATVHLIP